MTSIEKTNDRLVLDVRPWGISLMYLAFWFFMTWGTIRLLTEDEPVFYTGCAALIAVIMLLGFFKSAQRTWIVLDQSSGWLRVIRRSLMGRQEIWIPLAAIVKVYVTTIPVQRTAWRSQLFLDHTEPAVKNPLALVTALQRADDAFQSEAALTTWLYDHGYLDYRTEFPTSERA